MNDPAAAAYFDLGCRQSGSLTFPPWTYAGSEGIISMKLAKKYYMLRMNDNGIPVITEHDTLEECYEELNSTTVQHWSIRLLATGKEIEGSDADHS